MGNGEHIGYCHFEMLNWLSMEKRMDYLKLSMLYNVYYCCAPPYMLEQFVKSTNNHSHSTIMSTVIFFVPQVKTQGHNSLNFVL